MAGVYEKLANLQTSIYSIPPKQINQEGATSCMATDSTANRSIKMTSISGHCII